MKREKDVITLGGWPNGKNTVASETRLPKGSLREALNVDLDDAGRPSRRDGYTQRYAGADIHSLWSTLSVTLFAESGVLKRLLPGFTAVPLYTLTDPSAEISYTEAAGDVLFSNGTDRGKVNKDLQGDFWGIQRPPSQPLVAASSAPGQLRAGQYQVAVAYENAAGEVSGSSLAAVVTVAEGQSIKVSALPQPEETQVTGIRVYCTEPNGQVLYHQTTQPLAVDTVYLASIVNGPVLDTQFLAEPPAGHIVRYFSGRVYIAKDSVLWYTEASRYGLYRPSGNFFQFPERITIVQPTVDGIYVVADKTYFLAGTDPAKMQQLVVSPDRGVEGTGLELDRSVFDQLNVDFSGKLGYWFSEQGIVLGLPGGTIQAVSQDKVVVADYGKGVSMFKQHDGIQQVLTSLREKGAEASFGASDSATAEVIKNGIVI